MLGRVNTIKSIRRSKRIVADGSLISVAGLIGRPVYHAGGEEVGLVSDLVVRMDTKQTYPPLAGILAKVGRRVSWLSASEVDNITGDGVWLNTTILNLKDYQARDAEVCLARDVLDHQLVDVDGARVVRSSDLYITFIAGNVRLIGVDVGFMALLRRIGPAFWRTRPAPGAIIDWSTVQSFGGDKNGVHGLKFAATKGNLHRLHPGELADLLEDLGRDERQELLTVLPIEKAADALEEMQPEELESLLRESDPENAADLLDSMEPDEAADALRDVDEETRGDLLARMSEESAQQVEGILAYDEDSAGGSMNPTIVEASPKETVESLEKRMHSMDTDISELEGVALVDNKGALIYDIPLVKVIMARPNQKLNELTDSDYKVATVSPDTSIDEVAKVLVASRRSSVVVVDAKNRPLGRILADDVIDALLPQRSRFRFPRLLK